MSNSSSSEDALFGTFPLDPSLSSLDRVRASFESLAVLPNRCFERQSQRDLKHISADPKGIMEQEITLTPYYCSDRQVIHGSAGSLLLEAVTISALVIVSKDGFWAVENRKHPGRAHTAAVTRSMTVTWLRPAIVGSTLKLVGTVVHIGPRTALVRGEIFDKQSGRLVAVCNHELISLVGNEAAIKKFGRNTKESSML